MFRALVRWEGNALVLTLAAALLAAALAWGLTTEPAGAQDAGVPAAPSGLTVSDATQIQFTLSWNAVAGAADYQVKRGADGELTTATGTSHRFWGPNAGTAYTLYVRARNAQGGSSAWATASASTLAPGLAAPTNVTATVSSPTDVTLSWDAVPGAVFYSVWSSGASGANTTGTSHTVTGLSANASHYVSVRAQAGQPDNPDVSPWVTRTATMPALPSPPPPAPSGLTVSAATQVQFTLSWNAVAGAADYQVRRDAAGAITAVTGTSHRFRGSNAGTAYTIYVRARNAQGVASAWATASASTLAPGLAAPTNVTATGNGSTGITLSWDAVPGAASYSVWSSGAPSGDTTNTSYTISGLSANVSHIVTVRAQAGQSDNPDVSPWVTRTVTIPALPAPTGLGASAAGATLTLTWSAVSGATGYEIKQGADSTATAVASGASHSFGSLTANTVYTLYVRAVNSSGSSDWSSLSATTAPAAPSGLSASANGATLTLSWSAVAGATGYEVKQGASGTAAAVSSGTSHSFSGLTANTAYTLYVRAANSSGSSDWSSLTATTAPAAPSGLSAAANGATIALSWNAVAGATGYEVKQGASGTATTLSSGTSHTFSSLSAGATYTLYVRARNTGGASDWASLSATAAPAAPSGLGATATSTTLTLSWDAVSGATSYDVKQGADGTATTVSSGASHTFSGLTANTAYTLYVRASNSGGASDWASLSPTTAPLPPYVAPDLLGLARLSSTHRELNWTKAAGATGHEVKLGPDGAVTAASGGDAIYGRHSFSSLLPNVEYTFYVRAVNSWGASDWVSRTLPGTAAPPAPTGLSASADGADLKLSWNAARPSDTTAYEVKLNAGGAATAAGSINGHTFSGLSAGVEYTLYVRASNSSGSSAWSSTSATTAPAAPSGLSTATTNTSLTLSWSAATGATGYDVRLGATGAETAVSSGTSHTFSGLTPNTAYTLYVRASNSSGSSAWTSTTATTVLVAPSGLSASANSTTITLTWSAVTGATSYDVRLGTTGTETAVSSGTSYSFGGLTAGLDYTLYVRARNADGTSVWSSTTASIPTPDGLNVIAATPDSITLAWSAVAGATSYEVKTGADGAITAVTSGRSHEFTSLAPSNSLNFQLDSYQTVFGHDRTLYVRGKNATQVFPWRLITARTVGWVHGTRGITTSSTSLTVRSANATTRGASSQVAKFKLGPSGTAATVLPAWGALPMNGLGGLFTHTFTGLAPATTYTIAEANGVYTLHASPADRPVAAATVAKQWSWSGTSRWGTFTTAPAAPSGLRATPNSNGLTLSWGAVTGATRYDVKLGADGPAMTVPPAVTSYTFTGLDPNTEYRLYVHARNGGGASEWKSVAATTLSTLTPPPSDLTVTEVTPTSIKLSWDAVVGATSYEVKHPGHPATAASSNADHEFTGLAAETEYTLSVRGKAGTVVFPWRSITAKTERGSSLGLGTHSSEVSIYVVPTSSSLKVFYRGLTFQVKLGEDGPVTIGGGSRAVHPLFTGLTADTEYTLYFRFKVPDGDGYYVYPTAWRSITVKTLPAQFGGIRTTSFGHPGVALHGSGSTHISGWGITHGDQGPPRTTVTSTDRYFPTVEVGEGSSMEFATVEFTYYLRSAVSGDADPPVYQWAQYTATTAPPYPTRLSATATSASLTLRWAVVTGATGYRVKLGANGATTTVTGISHTFPNLTADTEYTLYVYAENRGGNSEWRSITASTTTVPPAPANLSATATSTTITLSWSAVTGATGYDVKQGASGTATAVSSGVSHTFTGLTANTEYTLYVRARNSGGTSEWNLLTATTALAGPSGLSASATSARLTLTWNAVSGATGYDVRLGADSSAVSASGTSHTFSGLTAGATYRLELRAKYAGGVSDWTSLTAATVPTAPSGLSATATSTTITLSWSTVTGATSYDVKQGATGTATAVSSDTSHTFSGLTANTAYTLYVRARNGGGASDWASLSPTTAPLSPYVAPDLLGLSRLSSSHIELNWTNAAGATGYEVKLGPDGAVATASGGDLYFGWHSFRSLLRNVEYTYYVRAVNSWGSSDWVSRTESGTAPPPAPSGLSASVDGADLKLSWTAARPSDTTAYEVKLNADGTATAADSINGHTFSGISAGMTYTLYVRAKTGSRVSAWSSAAATTAPAAPSDLSAAATDAALTLSWSAATGATSYDVKQGESGTVTAVPSGTSHTFSGLTANTAYTLYVRASNSGGVSDWSSTTATTLLGAPSGLSAAAASTTITLSWSAVSGATSYDVKRGASGDVTAVPSGTKHTFSSLTANTAYTLYARARNSSGTSAWASVAATTVLPAPGGLSASAAGATITLSWTTVAGATGYDVKQGENGAVVAVPSGTSHAFSGLTEDTVYTLYVRARNSGRTSAWSSTAASIPGLSVIAATRNSLTLSWSAVPRATSYDVKRGAGGATTVVSSGTNHAFSGLAAGTEYILYVRGRNSTETFPWRSITAKTELPLRHRLTVMRVTSSSITLGSATLNSTLEVKLGLDGDATRVSSSSSVQYSPTAWDVAYYSHTLTGLTADTEYTLYMRSATYGRRSFSPWRSITVRTRPLSESGISATASDTTLTLSWDHTAGPSSYSVRQGGTEAASTMSNGVRLFSSLTPGTRYTFHVRPADSAATAAWSTVTATTAPALPTRLSVKRSANATGISLTLRWAAMPGATGYRVKLGESGTITTVTDTSHIFTGLTAGTEYTLYLYAENRYGSSEWTSITVSTAP